MTTQVESALKQLASVSQSLNQVSDELSTQLAEIEKALNRFNLGVPAQVDLQMIVGDSQNDRWTRIEELRYGKIEGKWGLLWVCYIAEDPESTWNEKFVRDSPRDIRLLSVKKLPELLSELARMAAALSSDTAERLREAKEIAAALNEQ